MRIVSIVMKGSTPLILYMSQMLYARQSAREILTFLSDF